MEELDDKDLVAAIIEKELAAYFIFEKDEGFEYFGKFHIQAITYSERNHLPKFDAFAQIYVGRTYAEYLTAFRKRDDWDEFPDVEIELLNGIKLVPFMAELTLVFTGKEQMESICLDLLGFLGFDADSTYRQLTAYSTYCLISIPDWVSKMNWDKQLNDGDFF